MKFHLIAAYVGLFLFVWNGTTMILDFSVLHLASTAIGFMMAGHHYTHYKELKALKQSREETARVVTLANDALAPLNKQILLDLLDLQYQVRYWPCSKNTVVTEGLEYTWYGLKKNDTYVSIGGKT
jgi:hypothetical protein